MPHGTRFTCLPAVLALLAAAAPALADDARATPQPPAAQAEVGSSFGDVLRLLVGKEYVAQVHADALLAAEKSDPAGAVANLARILAARGQLPGSGADAVVALAASPGGGASARALAELLRALVETQRITGDELDALQTPDGVRRITFVPELVRAQIREQVKRDVIEQMKRENWATPKAFPEWTRRLTVKGDVRTRYERIIFRKGNASTGEFPDWNAIDNGSPVDWNLVDPVSNERFLDVDRNRTRARLRARLGLDAEVSPGVVANLRLASGDGSSPVSTNQTLGGSAGNFGKYQVWLDRAAIRCTLLRGDTRNLTIQVGRFANPFFSTDLVWDEDLNLDGIALQGDQALGTSLRSFVTAGVFPVFNTALNFSPERSDKFKSRDKWLLAAQLGGEYRVGERGALQLAAALYSFRDVEGRMSSPCDTDLKGVGCDTDATRPAFAQNGNSYQLLRTPSDLALAAEAAAGSAPQYQYFGLVTPFRELAITGRLEVLPTTRLKVGVDAEFVRNLAFRPSDIGNTTPINNKKPCDGDLCPFGGGNLGYTGRLAVSSPGAGKRWDWSAWLAYRYLESDAVLDAFTDSDFGLGGTNLKGYSAGASLCPADDLTLGLRWYSASQVAGPPYAVDILQVDLGARY